MRNESIMPRSVMVPFFICDDFVLSVVLPLFKRGKNRFAPHKADHFGDEHSGKDSDAVDQDIFRCACPSGNKGLVIFIAAGKQNT